MTETATAPLADWLAERRAQGAQRHDPVRFRLIEAMAQRAAGHHGLAAERLAQRLQQLAAAYDDALRAAAPAAAVAAAARPAAPAPTSPLGQLLAALAAHAPAEPELRTLRDFRSTWSRLSAERRLSQSLAVVPDNAGPLNSQQLVHRALRLMGELSPGYLDHFVQQVDALLWLDQLNAAGAAPRKPAAADRRRGNH